MEDEIEAFSERLARLETLNASIMSALPTLVDGLALPIFAIIDIEDVGGPAETKRQDTITKQRTKKCKVIVTIDVAYTYIGPVKGKDGKTTIGNTYTVVTTITVEEQCSGDATTSFKKVTSTHKAKATFDVGKTDKPTSGETKRFDGTEIDTLDYPHGTKVKTSLKDEKVKVEITYPDGQTDSVDVP